MFPLLMAKPLNRPAIFASCFILISAKNMPNPHVQILVKQFKRVGLTKLLSLQVLKNKTACMDT
jgi:hypothetical protein